MKESVKSPTVPKVTTIDGGSPDETTPPLHLTKAHHPFWRRLRHQVQISHGGLTPAAEALIDSAAMSYQAERKARAFASEASEEGDRKVYLAFQAEARSESRSLRGALNGLRLAGDRSTATGKSTVAAVDRETQNRTNRWT